MGYYDPITGGNRTPNPEPSKKPRQVAKNREKKPNPRTRTRTLTRTRTRTGAAGTENRLIVYAHKRQARRTIDMADGPVV